jgi:subtilase family serine protease/subtilisin family serine protease
MNRRLAGTTLGTAVLAAAVTLGVSAQPRAPQATNTSGASPIRLRAVTFTPARGERPAIPSALAARESVPGRRGYYIVQFDGPIQEAWKSAVIAAGADLLDYIPEFALKVRMNPGEAAQVARAPHVAWVGVFEPAYKLPPDVSRGAERRPYTVRIERGANIAAAEAAVRAAGATLLQRDGALLVVAASQTQLEAVAHVDDVASIEAFALRRKHNEFGGSVMRAELAAAAGYDGSTQTIAVSDTGLGNGTAAGAHQDLPASRIAGIFNWPGAPSFCFETIVSDGPIDVDTGHGTHVATSALGGGNSNGAGRGTAPASRLIFQAIEDYAIPSLFCQLLLGLPPGYYLAGIPGDVGALFQQSYDSGARVHSNSWGSATNGAYTADSASTDAFVWAHRDLAITISAGNSGIDANGDGVVDSGSLNSPATAKNVITVGASEGDRGASYDCDAGLPSGTCAANGGQNDVFTYNEAFGGSFSANPLRDDPTAGNAEQMAAFSSRGPTTDGRIKPDVVAPGTWILSGYSDLYQQYYDAAANPQNGNYQYDGWGEPLNDRYKYMGGTSMSAPLVAGAAAVVRDYYEKAHAHAASAALVKATLVNSAVDLLDENNDGVADNAFPIPNVHEGWGRVDLGTATDGTREFADEAAALATGETAVRTLMVDDSLRPVRVTVAWTDAPSSEAAAVHLVNDLDVEVIAPDGTVYRGNAFVDGWTVPGGTVDRTNNLENVYVASPSAGEWTIIVRGYNVPQGPQPFALVIGREANPVQQLARVSVVASDATATEAGLTTGSFTLTRTGDVSSELVVSYTISGTATSGADYVAPAGSITFAAGSADAIVVVEPVDDVNIEPSETVILTVVPGTDYGVRAPASATVEIASDDQPGDLVVSAVSAPTVAAGGATIMVSDTTRNQGSWSTEASETGFYLSTNSSLGSTDQFLGSRAVPTLAPGSSDTQTTSLTIPPGTAGTYYIIAKADWNAAVPETSDLNNNRTTASMKVGPDLVVPALSAPTTAAPGGSISITDTTRNDGAETAGASVTAFYLSINTTIDATDVRLGERDLAPLPVGASDQSTTTVTIPASVAAGSYYVIARADDEAGVAEAVESNNTRHAPSLKIGADLVMTSVSGPTTSAPGMTITISNTTHNQGSGDADAFVTAFYLSSNSTFSAATDTRLGERSIPSLGAGASSSASTSVTIPASTTPGMYYVIAVADDGDAIGESVETNNTRSSTQMKVGPDLMVVSVGAGSSAGAGQTITITDNLRNIGGGPSAATEAVFYLSTNTSFDAGDIELARRPVPALNAGASNASSVTATIPADTPTGSYYIVEVVDPDDVVEEAVETNNSWRSSILRIGPDLTVSALSAASSVVAGATVTVTDTTKNSGGAAPASLTGFYLSTNSALDAGDTALGTRAVPPLAAGATSAQTSTFTIPANTAAGTYYLIANANDGLLVEETSTTNNQRRVTIKVTK